VVGGAAVGVAFGSVSVYYYSKARKGHITSPINPLSKEVDIKASTETSNIKDDHSQQNPVAESNAPSVENRNPSRTIPRSELEKSRRQLRTLLVERELVSAALTRLYEAEASKEITREERETLGSKYKSELVELDEKISKTDAFIQIGDLETLRNQLLQLVTEKIESIEKRIDSTRALAEPLIAEMLGRQAVSSGSNVSKTGNAIDKDEKQKAAPIPDISDLLESKRMEADDTSSQPSIKAFSIDEPVAPAQKTLEVKSQETRKKPVDKVEELQKELLEALDRLERLDVETT